MTYNGTTVVETWVCSNCGEFVPFNQPHTCPTIDMVYCPACGFTHAGTACVPHGEQKEIDPRHIC